MNPFRNIGIKGKLAILSGTLIGLTILMIFTALATVDTLRVNADLRFQTAVLTLKFHDELSEFRYFVITGDDTSIARISDLRAEFKERLSIAKGLSSDNNVLDALNEIESTESSWYAQVVVPFTEFRKTIEPEQFSVNSLSQEFTGSISLELLDRIKSSSETTFNTITESIDRTRKQADLQMTVIASVAVAAGAGISIVIARVLVRDIRRLQDATSVISTGDLTHEIQVTGSDEISKLSQSFRSMTQGLRTTVRGILDSAAEVSASSQQISSSIEQVNSSTQQVSASVQQIAKGAQTQSRESDQVNNVVEKLASTMKELGTRAEHVAEISSTLKKSAEEGGGSAAVAGDRMAKIIRVTEESVTQMKELVNMSTQITSFLDVIRKIADQTNLLALNAAIEAARAGESGRGFAVVADEVKRLSESSSKAADEIAVQIKRIQAHAHSTGQNIETGSKEVLEGKETIGQALQSLQEIGKNAQMVADNVISVSSMVRDQVAAVDIVRKSVVEVASLAEETASSAEEVASATEEQSAAMEEITSTVQSLGALAEQLYDSVKRFKLPEQESPAELHRERLKPPPRKEITVHVPRIAHMSDHASEGRRTGETS